MLLWHDDKHLLFLISFLPLHQLQDHLRAILLKAWHSGYKASMEHDEGKLAMPALIGALKVLSQNLLTFSIAERDIETLTCFG